jgi:hypothetical protein
MEQISIHNTSRRIFFKNTLWGIGGGIALPNLPSFLRSRSLNQTLVAPQYAVYAVESGILGKDKHFGIGILVVRNNDSTHEAKIQDIRIEPTSSYRTRLNYSSNDRFKIPFAQNALTYFNEHEDLNLYIKVISDFPVSNTPMQVSVAKIEYYKKLFDRAGVSPDSLVVNAKSQSAYGPSAHYKALFNDTTGGASLEVNYMYDSNLLQLGSFITGTIMLDVRGGTMKGSVKRTLLLHLKSITNVETFKPDLVVGHDKIVIM